VLPPFGPPTLNDQNKINLEGGGLWTKLKGRVLLGTHLRNTLGT